MLFRCLKRSFRQSLLSRYFSVTTASTFLRTVKTEYYSYPYTECVKDKKEYQCANYSEPVGKRFSKPIDKCYDESVCKMKIAVKTILEQCECAPTYLGLHKDKTWLEYLQSEEGRDGPDHPIYRTNISRKR